MIGACSLVNRDIPDRTAAWGVPAEVRGKVEIEGDEVKIILEGKCVLV